ncbi:hypothetical protein C8R46DRAFT_1239369 [Mycena filopes]|nr:hypothetical protein C8R46DRAFT_1239369 [Mycena filopes]
MTQLSPDQGASTAAPSPDSGASGQQSADSQYPVPNGAAHTYSMLSIAANALATAAGAPPQPSPAPTSASAGIQYTGPWIARALYGVVPTGPLTPISNNGKHWFAITKGLYIGVTNSVSIADSAVTRISHALCTGFNSQQDALDAFNQALAFNILLCSPPTCLQSLPRPPSLATLRPKPPAMPVLLDTTHHYTDAAFDALIASLSGIELDPSPPPYSPRPNSQPQPAPPSPPPHNSSSSPPQRRTRPPLHPQPQPPSPLPHNSPSSSQRTYQFDSSTRSGITTDWAEASTLTQGVPSARVQALGPRKTRSRKKRGAYVVFYGRRPGIL